MTGSRALIGAGYEWNGFENGAGPIVYGGYVGDGMPVQEPYVKKEPARVQAQGAPVKRGHGSAKACKVLETGEVFESVTAAATAIGTTASTLGKNMRKRRPCKGYTVVEVTVD